MKAFVDYHMQHNEIVRAAKYVPLNAVQSLRERKKLDEAVKSLN